MVWKLGHTMNQDSLIEFPCLFPVKIVGVNSDTYVDEIKQIVIKHFPGFTDKDMTFNPSKNNNYLAITATVFAENKDMLDAFYRELSTHPAIKMVL